MKRERHSLSKATSSTSTLFSIPLPGGVGHGVDASYVKRSHNFTKPTFCSPPSVLWTQPALHEPKGPVLLLKFSKKKKSPFENKLIKTPLSHLTKSNRVKLIATSSAH